MCLSHEDTHCGMGLVCTGWHWGEQHPRVLRGSPLGVMLTFLGSLRLAMWRV